MKGFLIKCSIVLATFVAGVSVYLLTASEHADFCRKDNRARVFFNGQLSRGSIVYRRRNGFRLLNTAEDGAWYTLRESGPINYCNSFADRSPKSFTLHLPGYLYVWHRGDYPCVGAEKLDIDPTILIGAHSIEFNSRTNSRVRVDW